MLTLTVLAGPDTGTVFTVPADPITIGRSSDCNIMLHDSSVGKLHCEIRQQENRFVLHDLKSRNGTYVNNRPERIDAYVLRHRDQIRLGRSCLEVTLPEGSTEPSPPDPQALARASVPDSSDATIVEPLEPPRLSPIPVSPDTLHPRVTLHIIDGPGTGRVFELPADTTRFTVGRSETADFTLSDKAVSRTHFAIAITPAGVVLTDEQSLNGTFVNNERVTRSELRGGEEIRVCTTHIQVDITRITPTKGEESTGVPKGYASLDQPAISPTASDSPQRQPQPSAVTLPSVGHEPRLSPRHLPTTFLAVLMVTLTLAAIVAWRKPILLARGPLSSSHAHWEGECATCHSAWGSRSVNTTCGGTDCHAQVLRANTHVQDQCTECHTEHRGRRFVIRGTDTQCWQCHKDSFQNRPVGQLYRGIFVGAAIRGGKGELQWAVPTSPEGQYKWQQRAPHLETGLRFGHLIHAKRVEDCLLCHQPLPGEIINALGSASAFPSHEECIDCHGEGEVGNRDPQVATQSASEACKKCHTRDDYRVTREQRPFLYVQFSHNNHQGSACETCHVTITNQQDYRSGIRSRLYPLPMEACVSCHDQQNVRTSCVSCHQSHHRYIAQDQPTSGWGEQLSLPTTLLLLLGLNIGIGLYLFQRKRQP